MATVCWERGRLARNAAGAQSLKSFYQSLFALRAHCGRDARAPSKSDGWFIRKVHQCLIFIGFDSRCCVPYYPSTVGAWLSLVERSVRDREVGGSNPLAPTISFQTHISFHPQIAQIAQIKSH